MNKWKIFLICLLGALHLSVFAAQEKNAPKEKKQKEKKEKIEEPKHIYLYGVAINFNDSTVYLTDVQHLDSVIIHLDGAIQNYASYSMQLKVYLEGTLDETTQTCAVIYSEKKKALEKRYLKTRKKYQENKTLKLIGTNAFVFKKNQ